MPPPFLRIPPFPGQRRFKTDGPLPGWTLGSAEVADIARLLRQARVGGSFWAAQPVLPQGRDVLLVPGNAAQARELSNRAKNQGIAECCAMLAPAGWQTNSAIALLPQVCDPWHLVAQASQVWAAADHEAALVAAILGCKLAVAGVGRFASLANGGEAALHACLSVDLGRSGFGNPFDGSPMTPTEAIHILSDWRTLIDENRRITAILGVARWKRETVNSLLWSGDDPVRYTSARKAQALRTGDVALAWKSRVPAAVLTQMEGRNVAVGEIEDGMIRSSGLGANCVPPLSVIVDLEGVHFDPSRSSGLERILAEADMLPGLIDRAAALRQRLVAEGISKYGRDNASSASVNCGRRRILVPGQVEDDRSVMTGGAGLGNLALLRRARELEPDAHITYKPHPDVEAGHRKGQIADTEILRFADAIERVASIITAIDAADGVHAITSLAGFEALMRGKAVTCHGVPFYAGWGLTRDLAKVPERRGRSRTIDELVAAVLILYPRYCDPVTRLPCPVEVLINRLATGEAQITSSLIRLRQWQGGLKLWWSRVRRHW